MGVGFFYHRLSVCLFFRTMSEKPMQLRSPNSAYKCSTMSPGNQIHFWESECLRSRSRVTKQCRCGCLHSCECWLFLVVAVVVKIGLKNCARACFRQTRESTLLCANRKPVPHVDKDGGVAEPSGQIAHCLIYRYDGFYGFAEPYFIHRTLKDLVLHYRETSLFEHNDELDTTLRVPIGMVDSTLPSSISTSSSVFMETVT